MEIDALPDWMLAHERSLTVGTRVRTHVSAECQGPPSLASIGMYDGPPHLAHTLPRDDQRIGVIAWIANHKRMSNDHRYWVNWEDDPGHGYYYAAAELIPEHAPTGPERGEE